MSYKQNELSFYMKKDGGGGEGEEEERKGLPGMGSCWWPV
jgi:hypothetical protein